MIIHNSNIPIKAVIFDLDGTVYNKKRIELYFTIRFIFKLKLLLGYLKTRKQFKGKDLNDSQTFSDTFIEAMSKNISKSREVCERFRNDFLKNFVRTLQSKYNANEDIKELINTCAKLKIPTVCLSDYPVVKERLNALGIDTSLFSLMKGTEEYGALKPSPRPFLEIASFLQLKPEEILVIGDRNDTDGEAANNCNMQFVKYPEHMHLIKT